MTSVSTAPSILEEIGGIARDLDETQVLEAIEAIREHNHAPKLQLLILGSTGSGRATLSGILLDRPALLPRSPIPRAPVGIAIRHGERLSAVRVDPDGRRTVIAPGQLRSALMDDAGAAGRVEIQADADLLEMCDIRIEALDVGRTANAWRDLLNRADYVVLLLNAAALLSDVERRAIREHLAPELGLERVAIIVNQMDLIPADEHDSILELVRTFLGPFQTQPAIIPLSALDAARDETATGRAALTTLTGDLLERRVPLRTAALHGSLEGMLDALETAAAGLDAIFGLEESDAQRIREGIASRRGWLEHRIERLQRRVEAFVEVLLKEDLLRKVERFGETFRGRLPDEIRAVGDITLIRRHLPGYIETVWSEFLRRQMIALRSRLAEEAAQINDMIQSDLQELVTESTGTPGVVPDLGTPHAFHVFVMPRRGKHRASNIARGLSFNGLFMLFWSPPIGILSLAASQVIQRLYKAEVGEADQDAIVISAEAAARELERDVKHRIEKQFAALGGELRTEVAAAYRQGVDRITEMLDERAAAQRDLQSRRQEIATIRRERLPRLRALLEEPGRGAGS